jgi:hypothetical protein
MCKDVICIATLLKRRGREWRCNRDTYVIEIKLILIQTISGKNTTKESQ